ITRDGSHISEQFQREFERIGIPCILIDLGNGEIPELPDAAGIVIVPDAFHADPALSGMEFLKSAFLLAKTNAGYLMEAAKEKAPF
nr:hypothetical protein [Desulfobacula sp.]